MAENTFASLAAPQRRVAVIGLAGRFPGAPHLDGFWRCLAGGIESVSFFSDEELLAAGVDPSLVRDPRGVRARAVLGGVELFDADFFGYQPREAEVMDPQQRLLLECAWETLEDAGYDPSRVSGRIGVFAGSTLGTYLLHNLLPNRELVRLVGSYQIRLLNRPDMLCTRISYKLGLRGPSLAVQTACSTSLVALHLACQSLLHAECDMALAGAVSVVVPQVSAQLYQEGGILAPDGHCRPFDARAQGTVAGNGLGLVLLKRLDRALADGDSVRAVILGSAVNNDGSAKAGFTAPGIAGQAEVIAEALAMAEVPARSLGLLEAHGTATPIGDPIEVAALTEAFRKETLDRGFCALGSVKSNIGHLDNAAGVAGLLKAVLALEHGVIPPTVHFERPNPELRLEESPFFVNAEAMAWPAGEVPRRAGVSSFGIGGTNAHVVLEQTPPAPAPAAPARPWSLLVLSARTGSALEASAARLAEHLEARPELSLDDAAYTLQVGRHPFAHRLSLVAGKSTDAIRALAIGDRRIRRGTVTRGGEVAFLFPGQGAQRPGMGAGLYLREPVFREAMNRCADALAPRLGCDLRQVLYYTAPEDTEALLRRTSISQSTLFATGYALVRQWMAWGVRPAACLGHSVGEYLAACLAGVFSLEAALELVAVRGVLMDELPEGAMLAVPLPEEELEPLLEDLSIAAVNEPSRCVVAGPVAAVQAMERRLAGDGIACRRLRSAYAFHTAAVEPVMERFRAAVARAAPRAASAPFLSTLTGGWVNGDEVAAPEYWVRQLRQPVRFSDALAALLKLPHLVLLEMGPGRALTAMAARHPARSGQPTLTSLAVEPEESDEAALLDALGGLWCVGVEIDWPAVSRGEGRRRIPLPTYPFERKRFWVEAAHRPGVLPESATLETAAAASGSAPIASAEPPAQLPRSDRAIETLGEVRDLIGRLLGLGAGAAGPDDSFLDLGFDSLLMMQVSQKMQDRFGVEVPFRRLFQEIPTIRALAEYIERRLPAEPETALEEKRSAAPTSAGGDGAPLERILAQQLRLMEQQMELLRALSPGQAAPVPPARPAPGGEERFGPWRPVKKTAASGGLSAHQQERLVALVERHVARTLGSKDLAQAQRLHLADNRLSAGFRLLWKELVYPIAAARSRGSRLWDVDGNEYVDLVMGYGVNLFGHAPEFINQELHRQINEGIHVGTQAQLVGEVAELFCRLTGAERAAFCNTGSEAVMAALRIARTVTQRVPVALFAGSYHGISDGVLARRSGAAGSSIAVAPGIPPGMVQDVLVLDYGSPASLEVLEARADELAAVLVEPVQSARPDLQPREFLHALRRITERSGTALIFDEMISGFRIHPGGAQAWFDVRADLATYGKIVGGGLPIGVIAGRASFLDAVDGGAWQFGDGSYPTADQTFFAGTFCKHPLALAAARAVLRRLEDVGPGLQEDLNRRAAAFVERLDAVFADAEMPVRMARFGSLFKPAFPADLRFAPLFYIHLMDRGIHLWEGRSCFLSTAHTDEDLDLVERAMRESVAEMQESGFFPVRAAAVAVPSSEIVLPLTDAQERLWTVTQMGEDASRAYNESVALHLRGSLDVNALGAAIHGTIRRHQALRTTFSADGRTQTIHPSMRVEVPLVDLSGEETPERERRLAEEAARDSEETFDLVNGPLLRFRLLRLAENHHVLLRTVHHLVADGWSMGIVLNEIAALYAARHGVPASLPEPVRWSDWVRHQLALAAETAPAAAEAFWRASFAGGAPVLDLPTDRPRTRAPVFAGERVSTIFGQDLRSDLTRMAAEQGSSLSMALLATFQILLCRLSGQEDLVVGVASAGQNGPGGGYLVGYCVNLLPARVRIASGAPFATHLGQVRQTLLDAFEHQGYPFLRIPGASATVENAPGRSPLHRATFNLDRSGARLEMDGIQVDFMANPSRAAKFEIYLNVTDRGDRLVLDWDFAADLFAAATIRRWSLHFETLCQAVAAYPRCRVAALPLLAAGERGQLLREWNDTAVARDATCLHQLVEHWVDRTPEAIAIRFEDETLTYGALGERSNRVARRLAGLGAGPETPVGVCAERSLEMVVALLGVLKAGAAWVPLDPSYPQEHLSLLVSGSGMPLILAQPRFASRLGGLGATVLPLDEREDGGGEPAGRPHTVVAPENLAYILYTSGSTGTPKGAMNTHRAICNRLLWMQHACRLEPGDRILQKTPFTFDVSVWDLFLPLLSGAVLVMARPEGHREPAYLAEVIDREKVTVLHFVPSMLEAFLEEPDRARVVTSLRLVVASGEALSSPLEARFHERLPGVKLHNLYGPTEAAVDVTSWVCDPADSGITVPIGRPIDNVEILLLDPEGQPVPVGVTGELYIGGTAPARGYLCSADLTAAVFMPHPLSVRPGDRLYRTGDLARWRVDGAVEFLGRADHQVKLHGHRIELGEIEAALRLHPAVESAVVIVREDVPGDRRLAAYVLPEARKAGPVRRLAQRQGEGLPPDTVIFELPGGMAVVLREATAPELRRIFEDRLYLRHGIDLGVGDCMVDAGAGVGLFSLFMAREFLRVEIIGIEPDPGLCELLRINLEAQGVPATVLACSLGESESENGTSPPRRTVSGLFRERGLRRIDLLHIGAGADPLAALRGIAEGDWPRIRQIVIDLPALPEGFESLAATLEPRGYRVVLDHSPAEGFRCLFALLQPRKRLSPERRVEVDPPQWSSSASLARSLQAFLRTRLPEPMIPADFVMLAALPLTSSGKVDRRALPSPQGLAETRDQPRVAPRDALEEVLADLWTELLAEAPEAVGVHDDFFRAGGSSLQAIRLAARLRTIFRLQLTLRDLVQAPTVADLAAALRTREAVPGQVDKIARVHRRLQRMSAGEVTQALQSRANEAS